jgi:1,6-anhydro-N-acetylmuramate kinase
MVYKVIGLMSGSSLDGLDIAFVQLDEVRGQWSYEILHAILYRMGTAIAKCIQTIGTRIPAPPYGLWPLYGRTGKPIHTR